MMRPLLSFLLRIGICVMTTAASHAVELEDLKLEKSGAFQLDNVFFNVSAYNKNFERAVQPAFHPRTGYPRKEDQKWTTQSTVDIPGDKSAASFTQEIQSDGNGGLQIRYTAEHPTAIEGRGFFLEIGIPVGAAANKTYRADANTGVFPEEYKTAGLFKRDHVSELNLPTEGGILSLQGNFSVFIQDNRLWKTDRYLVRIEFPSLSQSPYRVELSVQLHFEPISH